MRKIISIIGTRPEIIKLSPLFELLNREYEHEIIHSGQHYDLELNQKIYSEQNLPDIKYPLVSGSGNFSEQISMQIKGIYEVLVNESPDYVIVQGDTNTSLSGALVGARLNIPVIHIEAGCRSGWLKMPEEQNRKLIDSISTIFFCSDERSFQNLKQEGIKQNIFNVGSLAFDAVERSNRLYTEAICKSFNLTPGGYALSTLHRSENLLDRNTFLSKIKFLNWVSEKIPIIFPIHPRTRAFIKDKGIIFSDNIKMIAPLPHLPFISLVRDSRLVITDSGGLQEESAYFKRPCLVLRDQTEWTRLIDIGKNFLLSELNTADYDLTEKLLNDDDFYNEVRERVDLESVTGASQKIMAHLKQSI